MTAALYWLIAMVVLVVIECASMGLTSIWFAGGTLVAAIAAALGANLAVQIILCAAVSVILLVFTRPWAMKYLNNRTVKTNAEDLVGQTAVVTLDIDNRKEQGQIQVKGSYWTARGEDDHVQIGKGERVVIKEISGLTCFVAPMEE